jgi:hypothetical protein
VPLTRNLRNLAPERGRGSHSGKGLSALPARLSRHVLGHCTREWLAGGRGEETAPGVADPVWLRSASTHLQDRTS